MDRWTDRLMDTRRTHRETEDGAVVGREKDESDQSTRGACQGAAASWLSPHPSPLFLDPRGSQAWEECHVNLSPSLSQ